MGFFEREKINPGDPDRAELIGLLRAGFPSKPAIRVLIDRAGLSVDDVNWDQPIATVWEDAFDRLAARGGLRRLVDEAMADANAAGSLRAFEAFLERVGAVSDDGPAVDHLAVRIIRGRPFVDRETFRSTLRRLGDDDAFDGPVLVVAGGPDSGRSYTWNLIAHVGHRTRRFVPRLIDLSTWQDLPATQPIDIVKDLSEQLSWPLGELDPTAQPASQTRVALSKLKGWTSAYSGQLWLVFDGLDAADLPRPVLQLVASIALAAQNGELGDARVILVGLEDAVPEVDFDPMLSRQVMTAIPLAELRDYLVQVAALGGYVLTDDAANALLIGLLGDPPPDPTPVRMLTSKFTMLVRQMLGARRD